MGFVRQVEAGTPFGKWFTAGEAPLPEDQTCADMYRTASKVLGRAGYDHYEVKQPASCLHSSSVRAPAVRMAVSAVVALAGAIAAVEPVPVPQT